MNAPAQLKQLLDESGISPANVAQLRALCYKWFIVEPSILTFVLYSIFFNLQTHWDDPQATPLEDLVPFEKRLLPELKRIVALLTDDPRALPISQVDQLVTVFRDCCMRS